MTLRPRSALRLLLPWLLVCGWGGLRALAAPVEPFPQPDPSADEQTFLELMNRARADPAAEGVMLAGAADRDILDNYAFFKVNPAALASDFAGYTARPPLAMNARLMASARAHSLDMAAGGVQQHNGSDGSTFDGRITATGYDWAAVGENVYAWVRNPFFGHVGFNADWGVPALDHRANIMGLTPDTPTFKEVGVSLVPAPARRRDFGPFVVTQDFAAPADADVAYVLGVVYADGNNNGTYNQGEGLAGVTVTLDAGGYYAVTAAAGGFVVPLPTSGSGMLTVTASGGSLGGPRVKTVAWTAGTNVKVDFTTADPVDEAPALAAFLPVVSLSAPNRNGLTGLVTVTRTGDTAEPLRVSLRYGGTAVNGVDYAPLAGRVVIPAGASSVDLLVQALSNEAGGKRLVVAVQPGGRYVIGDGEIVRARR